jgi:hypothetical protein
MGVTYEGSFTVARGSARALIAGLNERLGVVLESTGRSQRPLDRPQENGNGQQYAGRPVDRFVNPGNQLFFFKESLLIQVITNV